MQHRGDKICQWREVRWRGSFGTLVGLFFFLSDSFSFLFACFLPPCLRWFGCRCILFSSTCPVSAGPSSAAMFFLVERSESVALSPSNFGRHLRKEVEDALRAKVEGKCTGKYGFTSQTQRQMAAAHPRCSAAPQAAMLLLLDCSRAAHCMCSSISLCYRYCSHRDKCGGNQ